MSTTVNVLYNAYYYIKQYLMDNGNTTAVNGIDFIFNVDTTNQQIVFVSWNISNISQPTVSTLLYITPNTIQTNFVGNLLSF